MSESPRTNAAYARSTRAGVYELFKESQDIERELNAADQRIKRLEEAGDRMVNEGWNEPHLAEAWRKAKEAKL